MMVRFGAAFSSVSPHHFLSITGHNKKGHPGVLSKGVPFLFHAAG